MKLLRIGITHGDINGIGYELLTKVLQDPEILELCTPVIFGSAAVADATAHQLDAEPLALYIVPNAGEALDGRINLVPVCQDAEPEVSFGQQTEAALQAEARSLTAALEAYTQRQVDVLLTLPGHLDNDDSQHALSDFIHQALDARFESFDWICNRNVRTLLLHQEDVSTELGEGLASEAFQARITAISNNLRQDFGLMRPRLAVIATNARLKSDLDELHEQGINAFGPFDAKSFVEGEWQHHYDGCILIDDAPSRDQILGTENPDFTIGYVSGLPIVLTYPMQGIGYDIAGKGQANEMPLRQAIYTAIDIARCRNSYSRATRHPLEKQWVPRGRDDFKLDLTKEE